LVEAVRLLCARHDPHALRRLDLGRLDPVELEHDRLLAAGLHEAAPLEEGARLGVALLHLALDLGLAEAASPDRDFGEQGRTDPAAATGRHDGEDALGEAPPRLYEAAGDRVHAEAAQEPAEGGV